jgi:hypothetical protein
MHTTIRAFLAVVLVGAVCFASNPAIGLAVATGNFQLGNSRIWDSATIFEGNVVETAKVPLRLRLNNGVQMRLAAESRATIYQGRTVLERGIGQLASSGTYEIEARTLRISAAAPIGVARVQVSGPTSVIVAAMSGAVRVTNARGVLVATMEPGRELAFDPQAGAAAPTKLSGCLVRKDDKYIVVDQSTSVILQVQGEGVDKELGNRVEVTGAADGQTLIVANMTRVGKGGCVSLAKRVGASAGAAGAAGAAGGAGAAGAGAGAAAGTAAAALSTGAVVAIVGGVAVAASVGGLAAAGSFSGRETPPSSSR